MKPKHLLILVVVLAVLGLVAFIANRSGGGDQTEASEMRGTQLLEGWPINDVKAIQVKSAEHEANLVKPENRWLVADRDNFPADPTRVQSLLVKLWRTPIIQAFEAGASQNERLELVPPGEGGDEENKAVQVTFKGAGDAELGHVLIGKDVPPNSLGPGASPSPGGGGKTSRFLRVSKNSDLVLEVANNFSETLSSGWPFSFSTIDGEPGTWLNKTDFIKVNKIESIAVNYPEGDKESYVLTRESDTGDFSLEGEIPEGKVLDGSKVSSLKTILQSASFEDLLTEEKASEIDESKATEAILKTFEGFTYTILIGPKDEEDNQIPVKFSVEGDFPAEREVAEGTEETEEQKNAADQAFAEELQEKKDKLEAEKALEGHWFALSSYRIDSLLKSRPDLLKDEEEEEEEEEEASAGVNSPPPSIALPGEGKEIELPPNVSPTTDTDSAPTIEAVSEPVAVEPLGGGRATAVTPPIAIPPLPDTVDVEESDDEAAEPTAEETEAESVTEETEADAGAEVEADAGAEEPLEAETTEADEAVPTDDESADSPEDGESR